MKKIHVKDHLRSINPKAEETFFRSYDAEGNLCETRVLSCEEDYAGGSFTRRSPDNGRTFGEWVTNYNDADGGRRGRIPGSKEGDELLGGCSPYFRDPKTGCTVGVGSTFYYLNGHDVGYFAYWEKGEDNIRTHAYFSIRRPDGHEETRLIELEEGGADYDPANPRNPAFLDKNRAMVGDLRQLPDGDLAFHLFPTVRLCCRMAGVDVNAFFPSCPDLHSGLVVVRLHWNPEKDDYDMIFSAPIMLSDLQSSRCIMEPQAQILPSGRWMIVFRGSNTMVEAWHTRTDPTTPGFKWVVYSDDGGRTFSPPTPWHFDTREVVYSSASISALYRHRGNGRLYWIGNIMDDPSTITGNNPRWPLVIAEVNEQFGCLIKDSLTVIDTLREDEEQTELSNPDLFVNRETGNLEIRLTKINLIKVKDGVRLDLDKWYSEAWEYEISFDD